MSGRLLDVQQKYRELGRLRMGRKGVSQKGKPIPEKLAVWRLTSASEALLTVAAALFGGEVREWADAPSEGKQFEIVTETDTLPVAVPPGEVLTQFWEVWGGGGCKKRCDGHSQILVARPCSCSKDLDERLEDENQCNPHTRLQVIVPGIPDVGVWRLETGSMKAAEEMPAVFDILQAAAQAGRMIPARLRIDQREHKKAGQGRIPFMVPVLEIAARLDELVDIEGLVNARAQLPAGEEPQDGSRRAPMLGPATEGRTMPRVETPLSTDTPGAVEETRLEPQAPEPLPAWILELPGDDGEICDVAMEVAAEAGRILELGGLRDLANVPVSAESQEEIRRRLEARQTGERLATETPEPDEGGFDAPAEPVDAEPGRLV